MRYYLLASVILCIGCGDSGDDGGGLDGGGASAGTGGGTGASAGMGGGAGTGASAGMGGGAGTGASGGMGGGAEPCDYTKPQTVALGKPVTADVPSAQCTGKLHFYRFTPATAGVYSIVKSGAGALGFCDSEAGPGCICGININCCTECTLTFDLPDNSPLPASSNNQIYIDGSNASGSYTFTVTGPN